ncbi:MAG: signal peptidase I [Pseudomonadota bacterium]
MSDGSQVKLKKKKSTFREYVEALLTAVLIALVIRAFVLEAFKIPSGSMIPTLSVGDHIFVNKFIYGLRIPFTKHHYFQMREPKRGEVIVFIFPVDESKDFIKRVIGLPGDKIHVEGDGVWVNGVELPRLPLEVSQLSGDKQRLLVRNGKQRTIPYAVGWRDFDFFEEQTGEVNHVAQYEHMMERAPLDAVVPPGHYFVMGDNRDNSADSREWGFVPAGNVKGKAMFVWLSLDRDHGGIRWHEFGRWIE